MGHFSMSAIRPHFGDMPNASNSEAIVQDCVAWLNRVLRPIDEPFFYYMVEELLAEHAERIRLEVQSRLYQLIPSSPPELEKTYNSAWQLD